VRDVLRVGLDPSTTGWREAFGERPGTARSIGRQKALSDHRGIRGVAGPPPRQDARNDADGEDTGPDGRQREPARQDPLAGLLRDRRYRLFALARPVDGRPRAGAVLVTGEDIADRRKLDFGDRSRRTVFMRLERV
jgi:hypothetical protein